MAKFTTDYVNLIASNLRDRYKTGFPILKELVQNADDAKATELAFGYHAGFASAADHQLLQGPALWILNNGGFSANDREAIHSFGLNGKAADSGTIGKFGLGMKCVFHLCESFFYVAHDGQQVFREILNPWLQDIGSTSMHEQWEGITERDLNCLREVASAQPEAKPDAPWFLLWVPLRTHAHIAIDDGRKTAAIIDRYLGESGGQDLDFFTEPGIDQRIGALLPLLRHLRKVRFGGALTLLPFHVRLELNAGTARLDHETDDVQMVGLVCDDRPANQHLRFLARQYTPLRIEPLATLSGMLRLGENLVVRELLRAHVLSSSLAESLAYMPRSSLRALMDQMGFPGLQTSQEIHKVLVRELGEDNARFNGDYDIPLQLLASSPQLQQEVLLWAQNEEWCDEEEALIDEELT